MNNIIFILFYFLTFLKMNYCWTFSGSQGNTNVLATHWVQWPLGNDLINCADGCVTTIVNFVVPNNNVYVCVQSTVVPTAVEQNINFFLTCTDAINNPCGESDHGLFKANLANVRTTLPRICAIMTSSSSSSTFGGNVIDQDSIKFHIVGGAVNGNDGFTLELFELD